MRRTLSCTPCAMPSPTSVRASRVASPCTSSRASRPSSTRTSTRRRPAPSSSTSALMPANSPRGSCSSSRTPSVSGRRRPPRGPGVGTASPLGSWRLSRAPSSTRGSWSGRWRRVGMQWAFVRCLWRWGQPPAGCPSWRWRTTSGARCPLWTPLRSTGSSSAASSSTERCSWTSPRWTAGCSTATTPSPRPPAAMGAVHGSCRRRGRSSFRHSRAGARALSTRSSS
mmetsp:Transcript_52556/g.151514  ORF Transcript_52556/g.151514 Transcript_52556/m.151514 type:complete len:226 (-) Transcript_52556:928-1605(-)